jgi:GTPase SAR1 family protein
MRPEGIILVFDLTRRETFKRIQNLLKEIEQEFSGFGDHSAKMILSF